MSSAGSRLALFAVLGVAAGLPAMPATAVAAEALDGKALFGEKCAMCHRTIGMGSALLSRRPDDPSKGELEAREDLSAAFVRTVVRTGIGNMPRVPRGEVSDAQLAAIAAYLAKGKP